jgi:hypothetical protein
MFKTGRILLLSVLLDLSGAIVAQSVYITKTGKEYHTDNCRYLSYSQIVTALSEALLSGYLACLVCDLPATATTSNQTVD